MFANPEEAFGGTRKLLSLIDEIYAAVQEPSLWADVMESIAEALDGESTCIFAQLPQQNLYAMARTEPSSWDSYATYYADINPIANRCEAIYADGEVRYSQHVMSDAELVKTEFYNDFFQHNDIHYAIGIALPMGPFPTAHLSCQRRKGKGPFDESKGLVYETLLPHLQRALTLYLQFNELRTNTQGLEAALDAFQHAVFGLNAYGCVVLSNSYAEDIALAGDCIRLSNSKLTLASPIQDGKLRQLVSGALNPGGGLSPGGSMLVNKKAGPPMRITVTPFQAGKESGVARLAALIFISDLSLQPPSRSKAMRTLYGLTPTETRVSDLLSQGFEIREIATRTATTLETARFHVKRILAKTGAKRQSELMRLMITLPST